MKNQKPIDSQIQSAEQELAALDEKRKELQARIEQLKGQRQSIADEQLPFDRLFKSNVTNDSNEEQKIALFRSLFRGREDVYPRRFESKRTGKSGFQPVCRNEWTRPLCQKPKIKCGDCENRDFIALSDDVIRNHLIGIDPTDRYQREFVIGVYPMLLDETCRFLAVDFDKETWKEDSRAYLETCEVFNVPAVLERSRSGNGGHIWVFFSEPIAAKLARQLGAFMLTQAMESRPEMGFDSYDRFFPSQDTLPRGGFGNLIALPLQAKPRENGNSLFVDQNFNSYPDQLRFLSTVQYMNLTEVQSVVDKAAHRGGVRETNFRMPASFEADRYTAIQEIYKALLRSDERNQIIVADVMNAIKNNRFPVILTERKEHLEKLKSLLENKIQNLIIMKGGMGKKQRKAALNALGSLPDDAEKTVLATGRYLGEGFDDERLDTLFLTLPISWKGTLNQYAGRLHRIYTLAKEGGDLRLRGFGCTGFGKNV